MPRYSLPINSGFVKLVVSDLLPDSSPWVQIAICFTVCTRLIRQTVQLKWFIDSFDFSSAIRSCNSVGNASCKVHFSLILSVYCQNYSSACKCVCLHYRVWALLCQIGHFCIDSTVVDLIHINVWHQMRPWLSKTATSFSKMFSSLCNVSVQLVSPFTKESKLGSGRTLITSRKLHLCGLFRSNNDERPDTRALLPGCRVATHSGRLASLKWCRIFLSPVAAYVLLDLMPQSLKTGSSQTVLVVFQPKLQGVVKSRGGLCILYCDLMRSPIEVNWFRASQKNDFIRCIQYLEGAQVQKVRSHLTPISLSARPGLTSGIFEGCPGWFLYE